jgi:hypothetical protein
MDLLMLYGSDDGESQDDDDDFRTTDTRTDDLLRYVVADAQPHTSNILRWVGVPPNLYEVYWSCKSLKVTLLPVKVRKYKPACLVCWECFTPAVYQIPTRYFQHSSGHCGLWCGPPKLWDVYWSYKSVKVALLPIQFRKSEPTRVV